MEESRKGDGIISLRDEESELTENCCPEPLDKLEKH
jgi:hypothetical protein